MRRARRRPILREMDPLSPVETVLVSIIGIATLCLPVFEAAIRRSRQRSRAAATPIPRRHRPLTQL
jgi:hypothetical protein